MAAGVLPHWHVHLAQLGKLGGLCLEFRAGDEGHEPPGIDSVRADGQEQIEAVGGVEEVEEPEFQGAEARAGGQGGHQVDVEEPAQFEGYCGNAPGE